MKATYLIAFGLCIASCGTHRNGRYCKSISRTEQICETYTDNSLVKVQSFGNDTTVKNGPAYEFSPAGDTLVKAYYQDNRLLGGYYEYYSSGRPKKYICFDSFHEDTLFYRVYGQDGKVTKESGEVFYPNGIRTKELATDGKLEFHSVIIAPPQADMQVGIFIVDSLHKADTIRRTKSYFEPFQNNLIYTTEFLINKSGSYRASIEVDFHDSLTGKTIRDKSHFDFRR